MLCWLHKAFVSSSSFFFFPLLPCGTIENTVHRIHSPTGLQFSDPLLKYFFCHFCKVIKICPHIFRALPPLCPSYSCMDLFLCPYFPVLSLCPFLPVLFNLYPTKSNFSIVQGFLLKRNFDLSVLSVYKAQTVSAPLQYSPLQFPSLTVNLKSFHCNSQIGPLHFLECTYS